MLECLEIAGLKQFKHPLLALPSPQALSCVCVTTASAAHNHVPFVPHVQRTDRAWEGARWLLQEQAAACTWGINEHERGKQEEREEQGKQNLTRRALFLHLIDVLRNMDGCVV